MIFLLFRQLFMRWFLFRAFKITAGVIYYILSVCVCVQTYTYRNINTVAFMAVLQFLFDYLYVVHLVFGPRAGVVSQMEHK